MEKENQNVETENTESTEKLRIFVVMKLIRLELD